MQNPLGSDSQTKTLRRVALFTDGFYPNVIGGMQKHSYYLALYLARAGVAIDLYYPLFEMRPVDVSVFSEMTDRITCIGVPYPPTSKSPGHYIRESYAFSRNVYKEFLKRKDVDFIIAKGFTGWELVNMKRKGAKLPSVGVNFHGYEMFQRQPGLLSWVKSKLLLSSPVKFIVRHSDYTFSYGGKITDIIRELGVAEDRIIEIPTGIAEDWVSMPPLKSTEERKLIFVGRYERRKGIEELTKVLRALIGERKQFTMHIVGDIPMNKRISSPKVVYHGTIADATTMANLLRSMDVLICPSFSEGMPNVIMEGMACGLAIIGTDTGATSRLVTSGNGWLLEPGDVVALKSSITEAISMDRIVLDAKKNASQSIIREGLLWPQIADITIRKLVDVNTRNHF